ncbi:diguanylate cyclase domain-containing protein [Deinococcus ficus]|uniref:diguanylate cyclase domain-containing protein n=1 Tax=Deinococcus ficus TaxID=317577 RepID=UPI001F3264B7|nr:diguanylate cyclase [Deinococcus ficus]
MKIHGNTLHHWFDTCPDPMAWVDLDLCGLTTNQAGAALFGLDRTDPPTHLQGTPWAPLLERTRDTGGVHREVIVVADPGHAAAFPISVMARAFSFPGASGEIEFLGLLLTDVTEQQQAQVTSAQRSDQLERRLKHRDQQIADLNEELGSYVQSLSRDLQGPLRRVQGFLDLLNRRHQTFDEKSLHFLTVAREENQRLGMLAANLTHLQLLSRDDLRARQVALEPLLNEVRRNLMRSFPGREVEWHISQLPAIHGERQVLRQVFTEVLHNALKFTRPRALAVITIWTEDHEDEVVIAVRDNGVGFPAAQASSLFQVFHRLHPEAFEGAGVGLAAVRRMILRHGGRVWAEGQEAVGATFYLGFPKGEGARTRLHPSRRQGNPRGPDTSPPPPTDAGLILEVFAAALHEAHLGVLITDAQHRVLYVNDAFSQTTGYAFNELRGRRPWMLRSPDVPLREYQALLAKVDQGHPVHQLVLTQTRAGQPVWFNVNVTSLYEDGTVKYVMAMMEHANARVETQRRLQWQADHDPLTGLRSRQSLDDVLRAQALHPDTFAVVVIDLDRFKEVNDEHGHLEGDRVLKEVAWALKAHTRDTDQVFRIGGDEFLVLLAGATEAEVQGLGQRLRMALSGVRVKGEAQGFSMGVAFYPQDEHDVWHLVERADRRMYEEKEGGAGEQL